MFDEGSILGVPIEGAQAGYEDGAPALPPAGGTGASPDGIGGDSTGNFQIPLGNQMPAGVPAAQPQPGAAIIPTDGGGVQPMAGQTWDAMEPQDTSSAAAIRSAGFTALLGAAAVGAGIAAGGPWGAVAGLLLASGLANGYRAQKWMDSGNPSEKHEAVVSGVFSLGALGVGVYSAYQAYKDKAGIEEE